MVSKVDYFERLRFLTFQNKKVQIAKKLGISKQRLNYYFRINKVSTKDKSLLRKINYQFLKISKYGKTKKGYRKRRLCFRKYNNTVFNTAIFYGKLISAKYFQVKFNFIAKNGLYTPATQVYLFDKEVFSLAKSEINELYYKYNIVHKDFSELDSSEVILSEVCFLFMY